MSQEKILVSPEVVSSRYRSLSGVARWIERCLLISMILIGVLYLLDLHIYLRWTIFPTQYYGLFLALVLCTIFLIVPATSKAPRNHIPWYDILFAILGFAVGFYVAIRWPEFISIGDVVVPERWVPGAIAVPLCVEAVRRVVGLSFTIIAVAVILFVRFGYLVPVIYFGKPVSWQYLMQYLYLDTSALFGIVIGVVADMVLGFILFGSLLMAGEGGPALVNFALALFGRYTGGPAKVSVVTSCLFGMISGSVASNVVIDGVFTIPMMKGIGFKGHTAAAIEAVCSTGGAIMPPVMGAAAFIMAEFLGISYGKVAIAALIPALLYFLCCFFQVHLEASKLGLKGLSKDKLPPLKPSLIGIWVLVIPVCILIYTLMVLWTPAGKSALLATASILVIYFIRRRTRLGMFKIIAAVEDAGRTMLTIGAIGAGAGILVGAVHLSGSAFALTMVFTRTGEGFLPLLLVFTAIISLILGMGMPTTAIYVLVSVLVAPSLIAAGVLPLAAHLFVFYYAVMAFITLPVAVAVYIAAPIGGASVTDTGKDAFRLGLVGFIVPFIFVMSPALILQGSLKWLVPNIITALVGTGLIAIGASGHFLNPVGWLRRVLSIFGGILLIVPVTTVGSRGLVANIVGVIVGAFVLLPQSKQWIATRRLKRVEPSTRSEGGY
jgi:TRAP transporter 4TM/12TM fusion protein